MPAERRRAAALDRAHHLQLAEADVAGVGFAPRGPVDLLALVLPLTGKQSFLWKWAIIAAHSGFQGAMACVLAGASGVPVPDEKSAKEGDETSAEAPLEWLGDFEVLLKRVQANSFSEGEPLRLTTAQLDDIKKLSGITLNILEGFPNLRECCGKIDSVQWRIC
jgi:hypothetical protein